MRKWLLSAFLSFSALFSGTCGTRATGSENDDSRESGRRLVSNRPRARECHAKREARFICAIREQRRRRRHHRLGAVR